MLLMVIPACKRRDLLLRVIKIAKQVKLENCNANFLDIKMAQFMIKYGIPKALNI